MATGAGKGGVDAALVRRLERLSIAEIVSAAAAGGAPWPLRRLVELVARAPSRRLARTLARFDADVGAKGLHAAARDVLFALGAALDVQGPVPSRGPVLLVTNHPGAYDSLAMMAALGRDDVALVAAETKMLGAMPHVGDHLVFVADSRTRGSAPARAAGLRRALDLLARGGALVQYGAGAIEPDAKFLRRGDDLLGTWWEGTGALVRRATSLGAAVVPAFVSGVHSQRAKRLPFVRYAEARGITTIAPLVQATVPGFRDVRVTVRFGAPVERSQIADAETNARRTALVRAAVAALHHPR